MSFTRSSKFARNREVTGRRKQRRKMERQINIRRRRYRHRFAISLLTIFGHCSLVLL